MKAIILVAGYGTRLYPLTLDKPKALLTVGGMTILDRIFGKLASLESCDAAYVISNHKFAPHFTAWAKDAEYRQAVRVMDDGSVSDAGRLGAIGEIDFFLNETGVEDDMLVIFGDNLFEFAMDDFFKFISGKGNSLDGAIALYDVSDIDLARRYGIVSLDKDRKIVDFQEKPANPKSTLASTGVYYLSKRCIGLLRGYLSSGLPKDPPGHFIKWLALNHNVYGFPFKDGWYDIGDKKSLGEADKVYSMKEGEKK